MISFDGDRHHILNRSLNNGTVTEKIFVRLSIYDPLFPAYYLLAPSPNSGSRSFFLYFDPLILFLKYKRAIPFCFGESSISINIMFLKSLCCKAAALRLYRCEFFRPTPDPLIENVQLQQDQILHY